VDLTFGAFPAAATIRCAICSLCSSFQNQKFGFDPAAGLPPARHGFAPRLAPLPWPWGGISCEKGLMQKASKGYLTAAVSGLAVAIVLALAAILVRGVVAMEGKISADSALELRE
jgi:hypothetical protein